MYLGKTGRQAADSSEAAGVLSLRLGMRSFCKFLSTMLRFLAANMPETYVGGDASKSERHPTFPGYHTFEGIEDPSSYVGFSRRGQPRMLSDALRPQVLTQECTRWL